MIKVGSDSGNSLLAQIQKNQNDLSAKLASGRQVTNALDDASAQQVIDRLTSQVEGTRQAVNNVYNGISAAQVAEGGLSNINSDVNRVRELAFQSGNGVLSASDRQAIQSEIRQLQENITQTIEQTNFAGTPLLSDNGRLDFQSGPRAEQVISINTQDIGAQLSDLLAIDVTSGAGVNDALEAADVAVEIVGVARSELGAARNRFESAGRILTQANVNITEARSRIQDLDVARAVSMRASNDMLSQAATSVEAQANQREGQVLSLLS